MDKINIAQAWKDETYRNSLTTEQQALLPDNPAGLIELDEDVLANLRGLGKDFSFQSTENPTGGGGIPPYSGIRIFGIPIC